MASWDDEKYLQFADERTRASRELLARVPLEEAGFVVDLGCGPGNSTALLRARWPGARVVGVDDSPEMLRRARKDWPQIEWIEADAVQFEPEAAPDLIFANALAQWLPDHESLLPRWLGLVRAGGVLAVQMPCNSDEPSQKLLSEPGPEWRGRFEKVPPRVPVGTPAFYYDLLAARSARVEIWRTTYEQVMADVAAIVDWVKGTSMRPYLEALPEEEQAAYLSAYSRAIEKAYPPRADGKRLFSFPRLFLVAVR